MSRFESAYADAFDVVRLSLTLAQKVVEDEAFFAAIASKQEPFDSRYTDVSPKDLSVILRETNVTVQVKVAKAKRKVLGWTYPGEPGVVYLNRRRLKRSPIDIACTLVHEWVHAVDALSEHDFDHGDNDPGGKENTAPYWIDRLAAGFLASSEIGRLVAHYEVEEPSDAVFVERAEFKDILEDVA